MEYVDAWKWSNLGTCERQREPEVHSTAKAPFSEYSNYLFDIPDVFYGLPNMGASTFSLNRHHFSSVHTPTNLRSYCEPAGMDYVDSFLT